MDKTAGIRLTEIKNREFIQLILSLYHHIDKIHSLFVMLITVS